MKSVLAVAAIWTLWSPPVDAQTIQGFGANTCGSWVQEHRKDSIIAGAQNSWMTGFLSAYNVYGPQATRSIAGRGSDYQGVEVWMTNYCAAHPLDNIAQAAVVLVQTLVDRLPNH